MGKKKKGAVCNNPIAMARASGPPSSSGPTIRDYLARDRPSLEEATAIIQGASKRKESGALAAYDEEINDRYREELRKQRERLLGTGASSRSTGTDRKKKKRKKAKSRERSRSRSSSPHHTSSGHRKKSKKRRRRHHRHLSSSSGDSDSDSEEQPRSEVRVRRLETATTDSSRNDT